VDVDATPFRGAAPVNWAIISGETKTGVTTMLIEEQLDAGPILLQREMEIGAEKTTPELMSRLAPLGAELLSETLARLDTITPRPQDDRAATFAPMLKKEDGLIDWTADASAIERRVRGFQPWPNAYTHYRSGRLIIWRAAPHRGIATDIEPNDHYEAVAGQVIAAHGDDLIVKCGAQTALRLFEVQPEGKRRLSSRDFLNGTHLQVGETLC
jgi:methionyl-tRNA formyltransferase